MYYEVMAAKLELITTVNNTSICLHILDVALFCSFYNPIFSLLLIPENNVLFESLYEP